MPYIKPEQRQLVDKEITILVDKVLNGLGVEVLTKGRPGILNYIITNLINKLYPRDSYSEFNEALGVLDAVAREFYRRRVAPYEDGAKERNGDVY